METSVEMQPRPSPVTVSATGEVRGGALVTDGFSLAERYALLADAELEEMAVSKARAEAISSAFEGVLLDEEQLKRELLQTLRETRPASTLTTA